MKLPLTLIALVVSLIYAALKQYFPGFPIDQETLLSLVVFVLAILGVVIVEPAVRAGLVKVGLKGFDK
jgi:hypothetical protein